MFNTSNTPVNSLNSEIKDNQFKAQPKKRIMLPAKKQYTLVYSTTINRKGQGCEHE